MTRPGKIFSFIAVLFTVVLVAAACGSSEGPTLQAAEPTAAAPTEPSGGTDGSGTGDGGVSTADDGIADDAGDDTATTPAADDTDADADAPADSGAAPPPPPAGAAPDQVVYALFVTGGFVPVDAALSQHPELVVLADGTTYRSSGSQDTFPQPLTANLERLQLDPSAVAAIETAIDASGVIDPSIDFGEPGVTDTPFTNVSGRTGGQLVEVAAFALGFEEGLPDAAVESRRALQDLIDEVARIVAEADATAQPTQPPALAVLTFAGLSYQENDAVRTWPVSIVPVPNPPGADCVVLTGEDVTAVWAAAADATTQTPWSIDGVTEAVALRPVFPHEDFC